MGYQNYNFYIFFYVDFLLIPSVITAFSLIESLFAHFLNKKPNVPLFHINHSILKKQKSGGKK